jgi:hypothetical protein
MQLEVFWSLLLQTDSEGPTIPHILYSLEAHFLLSISSVDAIGFPEI